MSVVNGGEHDETVESWQARRERKLAENPNLGDLHLPLGVAVSMWPTPEVMGSERTPEAWYGGTPHTVHGSTPPLTVRVQQWATPQANADAGSRNCEGSAAHPGTSLADQVTTGSSTTGRVGNKRRLNPRFVGWLMGFDPDWCVELSRVDALRCYGNAVVPAQGAYALRLLLEALEEAS